MPEYFTNYHRLQCLGVGCVVFNAEEFAAFVLMVAVWTSSGRCMIFKTLEGDSRAKSREDLRTIFEGWGRFERFERGSRAK